MNAYNAPALNAKTNQVSQDKLTAALRGVHGVDKVTLRLGSSAFEITPRPNQTPNSEAILAASTKAGFPATAKPAAPKPAAPKPAAPKPAAPKPAAPKPAAPKKV